MSKDNIELKGVIHLYLGVSGKNHNGIPTTLTPMALADVLRGGMGFKPILRKLESMTEDEALECAKSITDKITVEGWQVVDYYRMNNNFYEAAEWLWLLSKGFDLFGLLDAGLAINANAIK